MEILVIVNAAVLKVPGTQPDDHPALNFFDQLRRLNNLSGGRWMNA
jgi:hypothetical protein